MPSLIKNGEIINLYDIKIFLPALCIYFTISLVTFHETGAENVVLEFVLVEFVPTLGLI